MLSLAGRRPKQRRWPLGLGSVLTLCGALAVLPAVVHVALLAPPEHLSTGDVRERARSFSREAPLPLRVATRDEVDRALATMELPPDDAATLRDAVLNGRQRLAWIALWDDADVDGDTVTIRSNGYQRMLRLSATAVEVAIPVPVGGAIEIVGTRDGDAGGGITASVRSGSRSWALPVMQPGETLSLPVLLQVPIR